MFFFWHGYSIYSLKMLIWQVNFKFRKRKIMVESTASLLLLLVIEYLLHEIAGQQCSTIGINGIAGCQCNLMEACDEDGKPKSTWAQYLPAGVDQFGLSMEDTKTWRTSVKLMQLQFSMTATTEFLSSRPR